LSTAAIAVRLNVVEVSHYVRLSNFEETEVETVQIAGHISHFI
jgi:hypothetical protein